MVSYDNVTKQAYLDLWNKSQIRPDRVKEVDRTIDHILLSPDAWPQYVAVASKTGVPAYLVGIIHVREASQDFRCHLHNGDPLTARTRHIPAGRPPAPAEPPFSWVQSAIDALTMPGQALDKWKDWTVPGICWVLERYNGFGYRSHGVNSPYLWGFTTAYESGLFTSDGHWNPTAVNGNPGGMAMLRRMVDRKQVTLPTDNNPVVIGLLPPTPPVKTSPAPANNDHSRPAVPQTDDPGDSDNEAEELNRQELDRL